MSILLLMEMNIILSQTAENNFSEPILIIVRNHTIKATKPQR